MTEKRHYERVRFVEQAQVHCGDNIYSCMVTDISLKGCLLEFEQENLEQLCSDQSCEITLQLKGSDIVLRFEANTTHTHLHTVGFQFKSMPPESMTHLRRLLELNTGNPEEIDRELNYMMKQFMH
ncbi:MAG: hypothetical protein B6I37_08560 [Desulfobacteraceae bacterium 4572_35.2]|nr:MAG: hypothetical protein B6I37_08560 [Desulfobacteraceae bacterium 4572_35.2]